MRPFEVRISFENSSSCPWILHETQSRTKTTERIQVFVVNADEVATGLGTASGN